MESMKMIYPNQGPNSKNLTCEDPNGMFETAKEALAYIVCRVTFLSRQLWLQLYQNFLGPEGLKSFIQQTRT